MLQKSSVKLLSEDLALIQIALLLKSWNTAEKHVGMKNATRRDSMKESTAVIREKRRGNPLNKKNGSDTYRNLHMLHFDIFLI